MAKKYTADTFEGAVTGTASGNVAKAGDTMTGDLNITKSSARLQLDGNGSVLNLRNGTGSYNSDAKITFGADSAVNSTQASIQSTNNPGSSDLMLQYGTTVSGFYNQVKIRSTNTYFTDPIRIGADSSSNELDDYEEGIYNIGFEVGGTNYSALSSNFGNVSNQCKYVKVGRIVTIFLKFQFSTHPSAWTGSSTALYMANLPFTPLQGTLSGGCMFDWIEHSVVPAPISSNLYRFPDDYGHVNIRQGYSDNVAYFYRPNNVVGYFSYWGDGTMYAGDWPGASPSGVNYLTGAFTYYTNS